MRKIRFIKNTLYDYSQILSLSINNILISDNFCGKQALVDMKTDKSVFDNLWKTLLWKYSEYKYEKN